MSYITYISDISYIRYIVSGVRLRKGHIKSCKVTLSHIKLPEVVLSHVKSCPVYDMRLFTFTVSHLHQNMKDQLHIHINVAEQVVGGSGWLNVTLTLCIYKRLEHYTVCDYTLCVVLLTVAYISPSYPRLH